MKTTRNVTRALVVAVAALSGCAAPSKDTEYGDCTLRVNRDAGMGVRVDSCAAWAFRPSQPSIDGFDYRRGVQFLPMLRWE